VRATCLDARMLKISKGNGAHSHVETGNVVVKRVCRRNEDPDQQIGSSDETLAEGKASAREAVRVRELGCIDFLACTDGGASQTTCWPVADDDAMCPRAVHEYDTNQVNTA